MAVTPLLVGGRSPRGQLKRVFALEKKKLKVGIAAALRRGLQVAVRLG